MTVQIWTPAPSYPPPPEKRSLCGVPTPSKSNIGRVNSEVKCELQIRFQNTIANLPNLFDFEFDSFRIVKGQPEVDSTILKSDFH